MKRLFLAASLLLTSAALSCNGGDGFKIPKPKDLEPGGVYVVISPCKLEPVRVLTRFVKSKAIRHLEGRAATTGLARSKREGRAPVVAWGRGFTSRWKR